MIVDMKSYFKLNSVNYTDFSIENNFKFQKQVASQTTYKPNSRSFKIFVTKLTQIQSMNSLWVTEDIYDRLNPDNILFKI